MDRYTQIVLMVIAGLLALGFFLALMWLLLQYEVDTSRMPLSLLGDPNINPYA